MSQSISRVLCIPPR